MDKGSEEKHFIPCHVFLKIPLWSCEVVTWLFDNKIIDDKEIVERALFL